MMPEYARLCVEPGDYHDWTVKNPWEPPPRTLICQKCGKHAPAAPSDDDYEQYKEGASR
jgi:hypothetical protein